MSHSKTNTHDRYVVSPCCRQQFRSSVACGVARCLGLLVVVVNAELDHRDHHTDAIGDLYGKLFCIRRVQGTALHLPSATAGVQRCASKWLHRHSTACI